MIRLAELRAIRDRGPLWGGMLRSGNIHADVVEAIERGLIRVASDRSGYVITDKGKNHLRDNVEVPRCPTCGQRLP